MSELNQLNGICKKSSYELTHDTSQLDEVLSVYKNKPGSMITILQKAQDIYGYLPKDIIRYISRETLIKTPIIYGVATFYTQFRLKPVGEYLILLCKGTACHVNGANEIEQTICDELNIQNGETTGDGMFTLNNVACLGCCSLSPVMMINGEAYAKMTPKKARSILRDLRKKSSLNVNKEDQA